MKIQRKLLTSEQKKAICEQHKDEYDLCKNDCPLFIEIDHEDYCAKTICYLEQIIKDFWNEEVEVEE